MVLRSGMSALQRYGPRVAGAVAGYAARKTLNAGKKWLRNRSKRDDQASAVTGQTDHKVRFKQRRRTRRGARRARAAKRFKSRVMNAIQSDQNPQWFRFKEDQSVTQTADAQAIRCLGSLYSWCGNGSIGCDDIKSIYDDMDPIMYQRNSLGVAVALGSKANSHFTVKSAHMEVDIANFGTSGIIMDIYEIVCRRDTVGFANLLTQISIDANADYWRNDGGNQLGSTNIGVTPYQMNDIVNTFRIIGKSTYNIAPGGTVQLAMGGMGPRNFYGPVMDKAISGGAECWGRRGMTKAYIAISRGALTSTGANAAHSYSTSCRRMYNVAVANNVYPQTATKHGLSG